MTNNESKVCGVFLIKDVVNYDPLSLSRPKTLDSSIYLKTIDLQNNSDTPEQNPISLMFELNGEHGKLIKHSKL